MENIWENDWRTDLWYIWGTNDPEIGLPEANIQHTSKNSSNVHPDWCEINAKFVGNMTKYLYFYLIRGPKWPQN